MRKYRSAYGKPYIRRIKPTDKSDDLRIAVRLGVAKDIGFKYVLIQRGCNNILGVDTSKENLKKKVFVVRTNKEFNKWANMIKKMSQ